MSGPIRFDTGIVLGNWAVAKMIGSTKIEASPLWENDDPVDVRVASWWTKGAWLS